MNIEFSCANCGVTLKVLQGFAGKTIQCPKCAKKTRVPAVGATPEKRPAAAGGVASSSVPEEKATPVVEPVPLSLERPTPAPEPPAPVRNLPVEPRLSPVPASPPLAEPAPLVEDRLQPRLGEQEERVEAMTRQMRDMELRLDVARLKTEKVTQEKQELAAQKATDRLRLQEELSVHFQAEIEAARKTITRLEEKVREATQQRLSSGAAAGGRTAAQIEKELLENPDDALTESETAVPDAVMADISKSRFSRYVRTSILIHAVLLGVTSVGMIKAYFVKEAPPVEAGGAVTNAVPASAVSPSAVSGAPIPAAVVLPSPAVPVPPVSTPPAASVAPAAALAPAGGSAPSRKGAEENKIEALPAPGEKPPAASQVELGL